MLSIAWRIADTGSGDPGPWRRAFRDPGPVVTGLPPGTMVEVDLGNGILWPGIVPGGPEVEPDPDPEPQPPEVITPPSIAAGPHELGDTVTATAGTPTAYEHRWQISDDGGTTWAVVSGATACRSA